MIDLANRKCVFGFQGLRCGSVFKVGGYTAGRSITVLIFVNAITAEETVEIDADREDELLIRLTEISALQTNYRTSVMQDRNSTKNMHQIVQEVGVRNLLEGGVDGAVDCVKTSVYPNCGPIRDASLFGVA